MSEQTALPLMPYPPRCSFGSATNNNKLYIVGGHINQTHHYASDNITDVVDVYDMTYNTWLSRLSPRPRASQGFYLASYGNYLYAIGGLVHDDNGLDPTQQYKSVPYIDRYDIQTNTWTTLNVELANPRSSYMAGVVDNIVYIIGGWNGDPEAGPVGGYFTDVVETFNLETEEVATMPYTMPYPLRRAGTAVSYPGGIGIIGGITNTFDPNKMALASVLIFIPGSPPQWYNYPDLPYPTFAPGSGLSDGYDLYVFGGWQGPVSGQYPSPNFVDNVYVLRYGSSVWQELSSMAAKKGFVDVVNLNATTFGLLGGALDPAQSGQQSNAFDLYFMSESKEIEHPHWITPK